MRFVETKNAIRAHFAEFGIVAPVGRNGVEELLDVVADPNDDRVPEIARECLAALGLLLRTLKAQVLEFDRRILAWHRSNELANKIARMAWAMMAKGERYKEPAALAA
jgi:transposase